MKKDDHDLSENIQSGSVLGKTIINEKAIAASSKKMFSKQPNNLCQNTVLQVHLPSCEKYNIDLDDAQQLTKDELIIFNNKLFDRSAVTKERRCNKIHRTSENASNHSPNSKKIKLSTKERNSRQGSPEDSGRALQLEHTNPSGGHDKTFSGCGCPQQPTLDDLRNYAYEGEGSSPGSISSCCSGFTWQNIIIK